MDLEPLACGDAPQEKFFPLLAREARNFSSDFLFVFGKIFESACVTASSDKNFSTQLHITHKQRMRAVKVLIRQRGRSVPLLIADLTL